MSNKQAMSSIRIATTSMATSIYRLKLIITEDSDVVNRITKATNRQTEVKVEAFASLTAFQKDLEEFYMPLGAAIDATILLTTV